MSVANFFWQLPSDVLKLILYTLGLRDLEAISFTDRCSAKIIFSDDKTFRKAYVEKHKDALWALVNEDGRRYLSFNRNENFHVLWVTLICDSISPKFMINLGQVRITIERKRYVRLRYLIDSVHIFSGDNKLSRHDLNTIVGVAFETRDETIKAWLVDAYLSSTDQFWGNAAWLIRDLSMDFNDVNSIKKCPWYVFDVQAMIDCVEKWPDDYTLIDSLCESVDMNDHLRHDADRLFRMTDHIKNKDMVTRIIQTFGKE